MLDKLLVISVANTYGLDIDLLTAQIEVESSGDPFAFRYEPAFYNKYLRANNSALSKQFGPLGACSFGLLQIILETAMEIGFSDRPEKLFNPAIGLSFGAKKMQYLLAWANHDYDKALSAYNAGMNSPFNSVYVNKVKNALKQSHNL